MRIRTRHSAAAIGLLMTVPVLASAQAPSGVPDESWLSLSGNITRAGPGDFMLDYGRGTIRVEMDDWDNYPEAIRLREGDSVVVYGRMDDDLFETRSIEANSVYIDRLGTYFYASDADEEQAQYLGGYLMRPDSEDSYASVTGTVRSIDGRELSIDTGNRMVRVDTDRMSRDPMAREGQAVQVGDRVAAYGVIDTDFLEGREIEASSLITLASADAPTPARGRTRSDARSSGDAPAGDAGRPEDDRDERIDVAMGEGDRPQRTEQRGEQSRERERDVIEEPAAEREPGTTPRTEPVD